MTIFFNKIDVVIYILSHIQYNYAAVMWLKYYRYGVKLNPINQSVNLLALPTTVGRCQVPLFYMYFKLPFKLRYVCVLKESSHTFWYTIAWCNSLYNFCHSFILLRMQNICKTSLSISEKVSLVYLCDVFPFMEIDRSKVFKISLIPLALQRYANLT